MKEWWQDERCEVPALVDNSRGEKVSGWKLVKCLVCRHFTNCGYGCDKFEYKKKEE